MFRESYTSGSAALVTILTFGLLYLGLLFITGDLTFLHRVIVPCSPRSGGIQSETYQENAVYNSVSKMAFILHSLLPLSQCPRCSEERRKGRKGHLPHARKVEVSYKNHKQMRSKYWQGKKSTKLHIWYLKGKNKVEVSFVLKRVNTLLMVLYKWYERTAVVSSDLYLSQGSKI